MSKQKGNTISVGSPYNILVPTLKKNRNREEKIWKKTEK